MIEKQIENEPDENRKQVAPIRVYPHVNVELTYQNFGSAWLCILRGSTEAIESVYNGLYNFCATNGHEPSYHNASQTCAVFWSDKKSLRRFFFNQYFIPRFNLNKIVDGKTIREAMKYARKSIQTLRANSHEFFIDTSKKFEVESHNVGTLKAERPDSDFKDSVLTHAFQDKSFDYKKHIDSELVSV